MTSTRNRRSSRASAATTRKGHKGHPARKTGRKKTEEAPARLTVPHLLLILAAGAFATSLGLIQVKIQFEARDYDIEAWDAQERADAQRDEEARLEARLGMMRGDQNLREAAIVHLGMREPATGEVGELRIDPEQRRLFLAAEATARKTIEEQRRELQRLEKEVF